MGFAEWKVDDFVCWPNEARRVSRDVTDGGAFLNGTGKDMSFREWGLQFMESSCTLLQ